LSNWFSSLSCRYRINTFRTSWAKSSLASATERSSGRWGFASGTGARDWEYWRAAYRCACFVGSSQVGSWSGSGTGSDVHHELLEEFTRRDNRGTVMVRKILDDSEKLEPPGAGQKGLGVVSGAIAVASAIAGHAIGNPVGGVVLNVLGQGFVKAYLEPIMTTGLTDFVNGLAERIQILEDAGKIKKEDLLSNERFIEAVGAASRLAPFTLRDEKRRALRNAVLNSALSKNMDALEQQMFFGLIDRFTELHLLMLKMLKDPVKWLGGSRPKHGSQFHSALRIVLLDGLPQMRTHEFLADQVWSELRSTNLVEGAESLDNAGEGPSVIRKRTTEFGDRFLSFISSPLPD
jgi:hypothetical protein